MFKGRSIDEAVETIHDHFLEAIAEGQDIALLQTDFYKAYDAVNREALLQILVKAGAPAQIIHVVEKVLRDSKVWLPRMGTFRSKGKPDHIWSRSGVRQGCPISPLLFIIVIDLLIMQIIKDGNIARLSAYMDDLGILVSNPNLVNALIPAFQKYERGTASEVNPQKCFILSTTSFTPVGMWGKLPEKNFQGLST